MLQGSSPGDNILLAVSRPVPISGAAALADKKFRPVSELHGVARPWVGSHRKPWRDSMEDLTGTGKAASAGIRAMAEAYNAPTISVDISMGHHKGTLSTAVVGLAKQLLAMAGGARLDALSAIAVVNDESEYIDLIEDRMMSRSTLGLDDRDPDINWKIKRGFICSEMKKLVG